jgi:heavy metal sensor kinase
MKIESWGLSIGQILKDWRRPSSMRVRLTFWYVGAMVVVLAVYAVGVFAFVHGSASHVLDERLRDDFQWAAEMLDLLPDGSIKWPDTPVGQDLEGETSPWLQVWSPTGRLLYRTARAQGNPVPQSIELAAQASGRIVSVPAVHPPVRVLSATSVVGGKPFVIQVARSEAAMQQELHQLLLVLLLGLPLGVVAAGLGGYSLARRALAPVDRMAERARLITAERLRERLPVENPHDELGRLAAVFNETLTRLESSFEQMRRFTADASHELRTPLTAIRSVGEVGLRARRDEFAYREIIGSMLEEADRLANLVDRLLILSRADTGQAKLSVDTIDICELAEEVAAQLDVLAEEKQQSITVEHVGAPRWVGDRLVLRQALLNLVDNAIKYSPIGGRIAIHIEQSSTGLILDVRDTGPGIPGELQARIFDRFYRIDKARSRENGGTGLGLSIAKWAVEVHGGRLTLENTGGIGSTFRIMLPQTSSTRQLEASLEAV